MLRLCQGSVSKESKSTKETDFSAVSQTGDVTDMACHHFSLTNVVFCVYQEVNASEIVKKRELICRQNCAYVFVELILTSCFIFLHADKRVLY